ncbi:hypothetical protein B0675_02205 [Streptomyces sp. M41(2017)]|uniref:hypothetical protein n=1 Tax=Streptomyces sp. M41(2017) TaxID=1955065 RepID=UPI0009BEF746|nr:hypothetical protein [Streptomyces sp. M41(2017)]OQQ16120.1 hypothetical protein B0675_02205 [Streptomyces sp. M41(2017)]
MSHFSLRKQTTDPEPAATEELEDTEAVEEEPVDEPAAGKSGKKTAEIPSLPRAVFIAVRDWLTWCSSLIGTTATYVGHVVAVWACAYYDSLWILYGVTIGLTFAVGAFLPAASVDRTVTRLEQLRNRPAKAPAQPTRTPAQPAAAPPDTAPVDPLIDLLWRLIGDAPGVHLKTLTETLAATQQGSGEAPSRAAVEAALSARHITLRPSVRDTRDKVNRGVHRDDLKAALLPPAPAAPPGP